LLGISYVSWQAVLSAYKHDPFQHIIVDMDASLNKKNLCWYNYFSFLLK